MTLAKKLPLAGFAALSAFLLAACTSTLSGDEFASEAPLVVSPAPITSVAYRADYSQEGALPFTCEVKMRSDGMIRRRYLWTDAQNGQQDVSIVVHGGRTARIEGDRVSEVADSSAAMAKFFARLILEPGSVVASADRTVLNSDDGRPQYVYWLSLSDAQGVGACSVTADPSSRLWTGLRASMADDSFEVVSTFSEYQSVGDVMFPSRIISSTDGGAPVRCILRDVEINPELPDDLFALPDNPG